MTRRVDVLIAGAGLAGLSLAAALARTGLSVLLADAGREPGPVSADPPVREGYDLKSGVMPRVSSLNPVTRSFLDRLGAWEKLDRISAVTAIEVWDGSGTAQVEFGAAAGALAFIVENQRLERALVQVLGGDVEVLWQTSLLKATAMESGYEVELEGAGVVRCSLLVGADGGNSRVRELCQLKSVGWSYGQTAVVTTVETTRPHNRVARQCFTRHGPLAFLPLDVDRMCSIVWSVPEAEEWLSLPGREFCERLAQAFEYRAGDVVAVDARYSFPLRHRHALRYVRQGVALIGDAAHTIHPLAGQGANLGMADARALAGVLSAARLEGRNPGDMEILRDYQRQRRRENMAMSAVMEAFRRVYDEQGPVLTWIRNVGMKAVNRNEWLKSMIVRLASGI